MWRREGILHPFLPMFGSQFRLSSLLRRRPGAASRPFYPPLPCKGAAVSTPNPFLPDHWPALITWSPPSADLWSCRDGGPQGYRRAAADSPSVASQAKKARTKRSASDGDGDAVGGDEGEDDDKPGISTSEAIEWFQKLLDFTKAEKAGGAGASIRIGRRTAGGNASIAEASAAPAASKAAVEPLKGAWAAAATAASTTAAAGSGKEDYMEVMEAAESAAAAATASAATAGEAAPATAPNTAISPDAAAIGPIIVADGGPAGGGAGEGQAGEGGRTAAAAEDDDDEASKKAAADDMRVLMGLGAPGAPTCELADHAVPSGCTAVVALLAGDELLVANAGDSRAIVCRAGVAVALSQDHKPQQEGEAARIAAAGGFVTAAGRVNGNLNLSRSIGDLKYKQNKTVPPEAQMITAEPDVTTYLLTPKDEFLVLACDGVWDCMTNDEVAAFVRERLPQMTPSQIAEAIFDRCISEDPRRTGGLGGDNMTCLICVFKPPS
ncbi:unnamed protein product [Phaeothamnion confervicola]